MARLNLHLKLWTEQEAATREHNNLRARHHLYLPLSHLEGALEYTLAKGDMIGLEQGIERWHVAASHKGFPIFKCARVQIIRRLQFFLVVPISDSD